MVQGDFEGIITCNCHEMSVIGYNLSSERKREKIEEKNRKKTIWQQTKKNRDKDRMIIKNEE